jgi:hypothetical protein
MNFEQLINRPVLDACCGPKMFWFNPQDERTLFIDKRREILTSDSRQGRRQISIDPDLIADFTNLPFPKDNFHLVVFDPPHLTRNGKNSWMGKKYGTLKGNWREELRMGFEQCFRVLKPFGTLIFKWNEGDISLAEILELTPNKPLFGNRYGKSLKSHWIVFIKT